MNLCHSLELMLERDLVPLLPFEMTSTGSQLLLFQPAAHLNCNSNLYTTRLFINSLITTSHFQQNYLFWLSWLTWTNYNFGVHLNSVLTSHFSGSLEPIHTANETLN